MMNNQGIRRVIIEKVIPEIDGGRFPIKRVVGQKVLVRCDAFSDGHDEVVATLLYKKADSKKWESLPMRSLGNDRWEALFTAEEMSTYFYTVEAWVDHFLTWQKDIQKKHNAGQDVNVDIMIGVQLMQEAAKRADGIGSKKLKETVQILNSQKNIEKSIMRISSSELGNLMRSYPDKRFSTTYEKELMVIVERQKALFSSWYEIFPRSCSSKGKHGTFIDCIKLLPEIAHMGFDILYLPPIHPIGKTNRKGKNNILVTSTDDVGSPWAIGSSKGGHTSVEQALGTINDFKKLEKEAKKFNIEIALDLAFQCSPDHPYIKGYPEWFRKRPDGSIQFAENPPKKYEDIVPFNFESNHWQKLWDELKNIVLFWIDKGVLVFRVDNPHTKPFSFWEWLITNIKKEYPEAIFLSEAFTRPKVMCRLAKVGFSQSYTYFTWRNTKHEIIQYMTELTTTEIREYFRPNFWPNTPDILPEFLQSDGRNAFIIRLILAATLSSNYGIYGPAFELCVNHALPGREEYLNAEKYEIKDWNREQEGNLSDIIAGVNRIRKENPALQQTSNINFLEIDNDTLIAYAKTNENLSNIIIVVVNLDPFHTQSGWIIVPLHELEIDPARPFLVHDLLSGDKYVWNGERNYIELNPSAMSAHILLVHRRMRREQDFDYFM
jgi:starch synthase (maltosyl-transferring)